MADLTSVLQLSPAEGLTLSLALAAIIVSLLTFREQQQFATYTDVDGLYQEVLKLGIDHPDFRDPATTSKYPEKPEDASERLKYEAYAYIVWNFLETLYDQHLINKKTWAPTFLTESELHSKWFGVRDNQSKFKDDFVEEVPKMKRRLAARGNEKQGSPRVSVG